MNCGKLAHKIALTFKQKAQFLLILPLTDRYFHKREIWAYKKPLGERRAAGVTAKQTFPTFASKWKHLDTQIRMYESIQDCFC